jgi:hypothetical protein
MVRVRGSEGLKSEALRAALQTALSRPSGAATAQLEQLLTMHGGLPGLKPNLKLAAAFGAEIAQAPGPVAALLGRWAEEIAAPGDPRAFLPVAAAHGFAQRIRAELDVEAGWSVLQQLVADERNPVRVGAIDALIHLVAHEDAADALIERTQSWLDESDRELSFGATAGALEALGDASVLAVVRDYAALLALLTRVFDELTAAPRSASRSDALRRVLRTLPMTLARVVAAGRGARGAHEWFSAECARATQPELRAALSEALQALPDVQHAPARSAIDQLRAALEGSQKPVRDAARVRPGAGRGRRSRTLR